MKLLKALKSIDMVNKAFHLQGINQNTSMQEWGRFMRQSNLEFGFVSSVGSCLAETFNSLGNRKISLSHSSKRHTKSIAAFRTNRRKSTCGLRMFSKVYRMRGFFRTLTAFHWHRVKFQLKPTTY